MTSLKSSLAKIFGVLGALLIAPFVAVFGLMMLGFAFGFSLIAVFAMAAIARRTQEAAADGPRDQAAQPAF